MLVPIYVSPVLKARNSLIESAPCRVLFTTPNTNTYSILSFSKADTSHKTFVNTEHHIILKSIIPFWLHPLLCIYCKLCMDYSLNVLCQSVYACVFRITVVLF